MSVEDRTVKKRICPQCKKEDLHPIWAEYFHSHLGLIKAWASWHYLQYMQSCNPNVPAVATKLFAPDERASLAAPTKFWRLVLAKQPMNCIYSKQTIDIDSFALDHFVPWSFVVHNRSWNLGLGGFCLFRSPGLSQQLLDAPAQIGPSTLCTPTP